jgi:repressor LexA
MSRHHLTQKQHQFLEYLRETVSETKVWPTYREIVDHFGYRSPNSVTQNLQALSKKGFLRRDREGYHLVDRNGRDGSVGVRWSVAGGALVPQAGAERITLQSLLRGESTHALRLDAQTPRSEALNGARFVFVAAEEKAKEGDSVVVLQEGVVSLRRATAEMDEAEVLGRYVGHAGPYGLVLAGAGAQHPGAMLASTAAQQRAGMGAVHAEA